MCEMEHGHSGPSHPLCCQMQAADDERWHGHSSDWCCPSSTVASEEEKDIARALPDQPHLMQPGEEEPRLYPVLAEERCVQKRRARAASIFALLALSKCSK
ncbi:UNVERIFIED_CONTAM: hypothetical protein K2H54_060006 [Gekko kuhli]